jgi:peptidoglycan/LPS O-acetylase OafA/YrhL
MSAVDMLFTGVLAITLLVPNGIWGSVCRWSFLAEMGRISYCLYVVHQATNLMWSEILFHAEPRADSWSTIGATALAALLAYAVALVSWKFLERPLMRRRHAFTY